MAKGLGSTVAWAAPIILWFTVLPVSPVTAQERALPGVLLATAAPPTCVRLTIEEAKHRALTNSKLLNLAALNAHSKAYAIKAAQADYFPKITGTAIYLHFQDDLGTVLSTQGRTISGPRGRTLLNFPSTTVNVPILQQNTSFALVNATQPLTDLLKVRQGVKIAQADEQIGQAQLEKGVRELASGVEQLYWGLLAARRIRRGAAEGVSGAELLAKTKTLEARTALVEAQQGLQQVDKQIADVQEQLNGLLDLPLCTVLELIEPPLPGLPFGCASEVIGLALAASPEIRETEQTICKARAAVAAGKLDFVPSIGVVGGYLNQTAASYIQQDIGYVGVVGSYTFVDWGKRRNIVRERQDLVCMAGLKLEQTQNEVRQKAQKNFRELLECSETLKTAQEMLELRKEAETNAKTAAEELAATLKAAEEKVPKPTPANAELLEAAKKVATEKTEKVITALILATKARMVADIETIKADLAYRQAYSLLMNLIGK